MIGSSSHSRDRCCVLRLSLQHASGRLLRKMRRWAMPSVPRADRTDPSARARCCVSFVVHPRLSGETEETRRAVEVHRGGRLDWQGSSGSRAKTGRWRRSRRAGSELLASSVSESARSCKRRSRLVDAGAGRDDVRGARRSTGRGGPTGKHRRSTASCSCHTRFRRAGWARYASSGASGPISRPCLRSISWWVGAMSSRDTIFGHRH